MKYFVSHKDTVKQNVILNIMWTLQDFNTDEHFQLSRDPFSHFSYLF